ncbi:MAG: arylsulfatase [Verrucomicrobia bacterium]|nr:arylsulfatase [Verrucomicrobiota bacterium]
MNRFYLIGRTVILSAMVSFAVPRVFASDSPRPNVVVILLDDMGYSDLGCYGGEIETPNMDRLAANGLRFTQFYNCSRCSPTRASLLTGQYPHRVNMGANNNNLGRNGVTLAELLGGAGYETAMAGKWHLSRFGELGNWDGRQDEYMAWLNNQIDGHVPYSPRDTWPMKRGFDRFYGVIWGVVNYFNPFSLADGMEPVRDIPDDYYITDAISRYAVEYIEEMSGTGRPFFLYVAYTAPHWPLHAPKETIRKYEGVYDDGWHALRQRRYRRQIEMGLIDQRTHPLPELMGFGKDWEELSDDEEAFQARKMAVHAAMVDRADQGIGRVIRGLRRAGELENTVIFVLSDNGASPETPTTPGYDRPSETEDGRTIHYDTDASLEELGGETSYAGIGSYWANAANTPFRYWKRESYEGGNHTPLIVHWPDGIERPRGSMTDQRGHVMDILPTCLDIAGVSYPPSYGGHEITPVTGKSLLPVLKGRRRAGYSALFFEHEGGKAVIENGWKAVQPTSRSEWFLYNLDEEKTEITDLAGEYPERLERMTGLWEQWYRRAGFSRKNLFRLSGGTALGRSQAPFLQDTPFTVRAEFEGGARSGVIVAQGGNQDGIALYVKDGRLYFAMRRGGELTELVVAEPPVEGRNTVEVAVDCDGVVEVVLNGAHVLEGRVPGLLPRMPIDGLEVGRDEKTAAGPYETPNAYPRKIYGVTIRLSP